MATFIIFGVIAALSALSLMASHWGVDSRDGFSDPYRTVGSIGPH